MQLNLLLNIGDASFAQDCFDKVRTRAGLDSKTVSLDNLIDERRLEFVGEGKRYFDLVRTGKAATVLKAGGGVVLKIKKQWNGADRLFPNAKHGILTRSTFRYLRMK